MSPADIQLTIDDVIRHRYLADGICRFLQELVGQLEAMTRERDELKKKLNEALATIKQSSDPCTPPSC